MRKIVWRVLVVVVVLSLVSGVALAAEEGKRARGAKFSLVGEIVGKTVDPNTLKIRVCAGNQVIVPWIGQQVSVQFTTATRIRPYGAPPGVLMDFSQISVGQEISVNGMYDATTGTFTADRATVGALPITCSVVEVTQ